MKTRWGVIVLVAVLSFATGGWLVQRGAHADGNVYQQARLFDDVLQHINAYYVDSIGESQLYDKAISGLLEELHDPYTVLLQGENYRALTEHTTGNYGGAGWITVVAPLPDTPAERAGMQSGDQIVEVDGVSTEGWDSDRAVNTLRGEEGSDVHIKVRRAGVAAPIPFRITRAIVHLRSVSSGVVFPSGIGYVSLNAVSEESTRELEREIDTMRARGMHSLILDLRSNPGGLLEEGVSVADLFLDPGQEVVSTRGRARGSSRQFDATRPQQWKDMPIVVLVGGFSASAAEILAGALQDHDRAVLVGEPTYGKGLVQTLYRLDDETALKITTARWYTPSGRTIQRPGRGTPADTGTQLTMAAGDDSTVAPTYHTDRGRVVRGGGGITPDIRVSADTLTEVEKTFVRELGKDWPIYRDALTSYALDVKKAGSVPNARFKVTPTMHAALYDRLTTLGANLDRSAFDAARDLIDDQIGYEVARYVFGRDAEFQRRYADDSQIQAAIHLLEQARTPDALMTLAIEAKAHDGLD